MKTSEKQNKIDSRSYVSAITSNPEYAAAMNEVGYEHETATERRVRAIGRGSSAAADIHPPFSFRGNMLRTIGGLYEFSEAQKTIDNYRESRHNNTPDSRTRDSKDAFYSAKEIVTNFNHTLRETVEAGAHENITFTELLGLMTQQYSLMTQQNDTRAFHEIARSTITGMRNEIATEMILIQNGVDFEQGTTEDDARGGDFIINGVPVDIKASRGTAEIAQQKAMQRGYDSSGIVWSHIEFEDFNGNLSLDPAIEKAVAKKLIPDINQACNTDYSVAA